MSTPLEEYVKGLNPLKGKVVQTYYSSGARRRASELADRADSSYQFLKEFFKVDVDLTLLVLNSEDWKKRTSLPYGILFSDRGMVHLTADPTVETPALQMLSPMFDNCPEPLKEALASEVGLKEDSFTHAIRILWDHSTVHEFAHAFCQKTRVRFGVAWLSEFFANYTMYAFLKRFETKFSRDLRMTEVLAKVMYEGGKPLVKHASLDDFEEFYEYLARVDVLNFMWYYAKFFLGVFELYERYGESFISSLVDTFKVTDEMIGQRIGKSCKGFEKWFEAWKHEN
jgi:hypothetical protein